MRESNPDKVVYEVYWVHLKDHTDITSQGYVGITCQGVRTRFYKHVAEAAKNSFNYVFHKALRKYGGEDLIVDVICICEEDYAKYLENSLRPKSYIGWNVAEGGKGNTQALRSITATEEFSKLRSDYMNNAWKDDEYRSRMMSSRKAYYEDTPPWRRDGDAVNHFAWSLAGKCYLIHINEGWGREKICNYMMLNSASFCRIFDYFKRGWNPTEDTDYQKIYPTPNYKEVIEEYGNPEQYHATWTRKDSSKVWEVADDLYDAFVEFDYGVKELAKLADCTWHQTHKIHRKFKNGWNPHKDIRWLTEFKGYRHEHK